ncbi:MAG TPA: 2,3-bisphosphoglycerate-dependent phosphoglycerate mutase, partial [Gammaproteobacteria bacterium]|nr:2,3-bisphosphoglycerate-dependent phosphoglycerate mutase [Gammaproteobacteria bacterium]
KLLLEKQFQFDIALTSRLKRAVRTLWLIQEETDQMWLPVHTDWRLNERHYGALQGLDKKETSARHGPEQVLRWRRGYAIRPPALDPADPMNPARDPRYREVLETPLTESLADTLVRVEQWWLERLVPLLRAGLKPLVVAHGNSLRALIKYLDDLSEEEVIALNIPTGMPLVYELDDNFRAISHTYLDDPEKVAAAVHAVSKQTQV